LRLYAIPIIACLTGVCLILGCYAPSTPPMAATQPVASTTSLYDHDWVWQSDRGKPVRLAEFHGHPQVIAMFFTTCAGTCGVTVNRMLQLDASLNRRQRNDVGFILVSFDSGNDTPKALSQYRAQRQIPAQWTMMRGSPQATRELADELGITFAADPARHILHSAQITILDRQGRIIRRIPGVNAPLSEVLATIEAQSASPSTRPSALSSAR
jgi:protein SCO1/2